MGMIFAVSSYFVTVILFYYIFIRINALEFASKEFNFFYKLIWLLAAIYANSIFLYVATDSVSGKNIAYFVLCVIIVLHPFMALSAVMQSLMRKYRLSSKDKMMVQIAIALPTIVYVIYVLYVSFNDLSWFYERKFPKEMYYITCINAMVLEVGYYQRKQDSNKIYGVNYNTLIFNFCFMYVFYTYYQYFNLRKYIFEGGILEQGHVSLIIGVLNFCAVAFPFMVFFLYIYLKFFSIDSYMLSKSIALKMTNSMFEGVIITDEKDRIVHMNNQAMELLGVEDSKEVCGKELFQYLMGDFDDVLLSSGEFYKIDLYNIKNERLDLVIGLTVLKDDFDDIISKIYIFQDVKNLLESQKELDNANKKLKELINEKVRQLKESNDSIKKEINSRLNMEMQIKDLYYRDSLTGTKNRSYFTQILEQVINEESESVHALMFIDLDSFKTINDSFGHSGGDDVIKSMAERLKELCQSPDIVVSRFGGDEFSILIKSVTDKSQVDNLAQAILEEVRKPIHFDNVRILSSASIGIVMFPKDGMTTETLFKNADVAMYRAKEKGKNQYVYFQEDFQEEIAKEYEITYGLLDALAKNNNNELMLFYQPQVRVIDGKEVVVGFEALMRWFKDGQFISPGIFIPVAEKSNLISQMGEWAMGEACRQMAKWNKENKNKVKMSVNLSSNQLLNPKLTEEISTVIEENNIEPSSIELEITETSIVKNMKKSAEILRGLKQLGVRLSVDDFGTKYSTFNYLKQLPIDKIKIDISFVRGIGKSKIDEAIILSLISLSKTLNMDIIAEGVESEEELKFLLENGCNTIQGFYYYKPMPPEDIDEKHILV